MKQISKKSMFKKKGNKDTGHWEGKYWCNCRERNYRSWLGKKRGGGYDSLAELIKEWLNEEGDHDDKLYKNSPPSE